MTDTDTNTNTDHRPDGGTAEERIFGTGEATETTTVSTRERARRFFDLYVRSPLRIGWEDWRTRIGGIMLVFYILMGIVGVMIVPQPVLNEGPMYTGPFQSIHYPLGTDNLGRAIGEKIVHATPAMLKMALAGSLTTMGAGIFFGFVSGYRGGITDRILMTITDVQAVLPGLPLIIMLAAVFTPSNPFVVGVILAIDTWPPLARSLRSQVLTLREADFVEAGRSLGLSSWTIIRQDLIPKLAPYILINAAGAATRVIKASVALYFLGVLPFSILNWGVMMNRAYENGNAIQAPGHAGHWLFFPALALSGLLFALVLFSQGLDRVFNPRLRARHAKITPDEEAEPQGGMR